MSRPTLKEVLSEVALMEARREGVKYTEKQVKNVLDRVTATLEGSDSATWTKMARRYKRLGDSLDALKEQKDKLNAKMKADMGDLFEATDIVLTRVVETAKFTVTVSKGADPNQKVEKKKVVDYQKLSEGLAKLVSDELQAKVDELIKACTSEEDPRPTVVKMTVKPVDEGIVDAGKRLLKFLGGLLKRIMSWATRYDAKLAGLKRMAGVQEDAE